VDVDECAADGKYYHGCGSAKQPADKPSRTNACHVGLFPGAVSGAAILAPDVKDSLRLSSADLLTATAGSALGYQATVRPSATLIPPDPGSRNESLAIAPVMRSILATRTVAANGGARSARSQ